MGDILQILQGCGTADSSRHREGSPVFHGSHASCSSSHSLPISREGGSWTCPAGNILFSLLKAHTSSYGKPVLPPTWVLCELETSTSDILPYLCVPHGFLKGSNTTLHPTWTPRTGPKQGSKAQPVGKPPQPRSTAPGQVHLTPSGSRNQKKSLPTGWPSWSSELNSAGLLKIKNQIKKTPTTLH